MGEKLDSEGTAPLTLESWGEKFRCVPFETRPIEAAYSVQFPMSPKAHNNKLVRTQMGVILQIVQGARSLSPAS